MPKTIYVPQGFSARFNSHSKDLDIAGLYTDRFSVCTIFVGVAPGKIFMMHVDAHTEPYKLRDDLQWLGSAAELYIFYRGQNSSPQIIQAVKRLVQREGFNITINIQTVPENTFAILASSSQPQIRQLKQNEIPTNLIHHPQEQTFLAVQKSRQRIGLRERHIRNQEITRKARIFDGNFWLTLGNAELAFDDKFDVDDIALSKRYRGKYEVSKYGVIYGLQQVERMLAQHLPVLITDGEAAWTQKDIAYYLEGFFVGFDRAKLYKENMLDTLDCFEPKFSPTDHDLSFTRNLRACLMQSGDRFDHAKLMLQAYSDEQENSGFKTQLLAIAPEFAIDYEMRKTYDDRREQYTQMQTSAESLSAQGNNAYRQRRYADAVTFFDQAGKLLTYSCLITDKRISGVYRLMGQAAIADGQYEIAEAVLIKSLNLKRNFTDPGPSEQNIADTEALLARCRREMAPETTRNQYQP